MMVLHFGGGDRMILYLADVLRPIILITTECLVEMNSRRICRR